jgi:type IV pilus assembly protein PilB
MPVGSVPGPPRSWPAPHESSDAGPGAHAVGSLALPLLDLNAVDLQRLPRNLVDQKMANQYQLVVLGKRGNRLFIGAADPTDQEAAERIKFATQLTPEWVIVEYDKLAQAGGRQGTSANETLESWPAATSSSTSPKKTPHPAETPSHHRGRRRAGGALPAEDADRRDQPARVRPALRALRIPLPRALPHRRRTARDHPAADRHQGQAGSRIKVISRMDIAEKRVPQDGRMKLKFGNKAIDFRVSTLPTLFGEKIVIRILDPSSAKLGIEALGYEKIEKDRLMPAIQRPYGMILVTGPTGSAARRCRSTPA